MKIDGLFHPYKPDGSTREPNTAHDFEHELSKGEEHTQSSSHFVRDHTSENSAQTRLGREQSHEADPTSGELNSDEDDAATSQLPEAVLKPSAPVLPIGVTEALLASRVFGIHLLAGSYLSELTSVARVAVEPFSASSSTAIAIPNGVDGHPGQAGDQSLMIGQIASPTGQASTAGVETMALGRDSGGQASGPAPDDETDTSSFQVSNMVWQERLLRVVKYSDGAVVAWVRDFRIDPDGASELVANLMEKLQHQGLQVSRVMLNGVEAWASTGDLSIEVKHVG